MRGEDMASTNGPGGGDLGAARDELRRLLDQADAAAAAMASEAEQVRRDNELAVARELAEVEELRVTMLGRLDAANERFGAAERVVETSRVRLAEIDGLHARANDTLADAVDRAAAMLAQVEIEAAQLRAQARRDADRLILGAQDEAERIIGDAAAYRREAELRAADALGEAEVRVEAVIQRATEQRHAGIDDLAAREQEIKQRIEALLADGIHPSSLGVIPQRRTAETADAPMIDLTEGVSDAIRSVIDEWSLRRSPR